MIPKPAYCLHLAWLLHCCIPPAPLLNHATHLILRKPVCFLAPPRSTPVPEVNGLQEPSLPKRLRGTPERIELENYRLSLQREEDLEEVPEETLAEHNLSSVLDKDKHAELGSR